MTTRRFTYPRTLRLRKAAQFESVRGARSVKHAGPLRVSGKPNDLPHSRLGLAVSKRVGNAPVRNAVKRRLREAFRTLQHDLPGGYDIVVSVRPHEVGKMQVYRRWLRDAIEQLDRHWRKRRG